jgi:hypothetical protein
MLQFLQNWDYALIWTELRDQLEMIVGEIKWI